MEMTDFSIQCDNPICGYKANIQPKEMVNYLNKPCPECDCNLLTDKDFDDFLKLVAKIKSMPESENKDPNNKVFFSVRDGRLFHKKAKTT